MEIKAVIEKWKLIVHLMFRTKRFGVNNEWWSSFDSMWGYSWLRKIWNVVSVVELIKNYEYMKWRAVYCHLISDEEKQRFGLMEM